MQNIVYPDGSGCWYANGVRYLVSASVVRRLRAAGVRFMELRKKSSPHIKVCGVYEVSMPDGTVVYVRNIRAFIEERFDRCYSWVLRCLRSERGYSGYRARKLYEAIVPPGVESYVLIPRDQLEGSPVSLPPVA